MGSCPRVVNGSYRYCVSSYPFGCDFFHSLSEVGEPGDWAIPFHLVLPLLTWLGDEDSFSRVPGCGGSPWRRRAVRMSMNLSEIEFWIAPPITYEILSAPGAEAVAPPLRAEATSCGVTGEK